MTAAVATQKPIIICDDNQDILDFLEMLLKQAGYEVVKAHDLKDVCFYMEYVHPSLLLLDIRMPVWDGFEVAEMLRQQGHTVPIIFITAHDNAFSRTYAPIAGAVAYFTKPLDTDALMKKIGEIVASPPTEEQPAWPSKRSSARLPSVAR